MIKLHGKCVRGNEHESVRGRGEGGGGHESRESVPKLRLRIRRPFRGMKLLPATVGGEASHMTQTIKAKYTPWFAGATILGRLRSRVNIGIQYWPSKVLDLWQQVFRLEKR